MNMQKLLTIVVPVYKVEPYINKCLDSLILEDEELMSQLEVIVVNDGTPDNSAEMSREYVKRYPNTFRQIDKKNGGHGSAWNVGLKEATGKYLRFLDSDDWLTNLSLFMKKIADCEADVVFTRMNRYYEDTGNSEISPVNVTVDKLVPIASITPQENPHYDIITNFWYSTYKTALLKPLYPLFLEGVSYDDTILYIVPLLCGQNYIAYDLVLYNYLLGREGQSMAMETQVKKIPDRLKVYGQMSSFIKQHYTKEKEEIKWLLDVIMERRRMVLLDLIVNVSPYSQSAKFITELESMGNMKGMKVKSNIYNRYKKYPYFVFYCIEKIRRVINKIRNK